MDDSPFFVLINLNSRRKNNRWRAHLSTSFLSVHFSTWSLFISRCRRAESSIETSALFIGLSQRSGGTTACLHRGLSPVCEKRLCLYLGFVRAADIRAPPSPHHCPIAASGDSSRSAGGGSSSSMEHFSLLLWLKRDVPKPLSGISTSSDCVLDTFNKGLSALIGTVLIKVMNHSGAWGQVTFLILESAWNREPWPPWLLVQPKLISQWQRGINILPTPWERTYQIPQAPLNNYIPSNPPAEEWMVPS